MTSPSLSTIRSASIGPALLVPSLALQPAVAAPAEPGGKVTAEMADCSPRETSRDVCVLRVGLGAKVHVDTVLGLDIGGAAFVNPSRAKRPQVIASQGYNGPRAEWLRSVRKG
jgi:hypothetical protein